MRRSVFLTLAAAATLPTAAMADGFVILPVAKEGFRYEPTFAIKLGDLRAHAPQSKNFASIVIEAIVNCGLFQDGQRRIRAHINLSLIDTKALNAFSATLSPRYTLPLGGGFALNAGPTIGVVNFRSAVQNADRRNTRFTYGAATGLEWQRGRFYTGLDLTYLNTTSRGRARLESVTPAIAVGYHF